MPRDFHRDTDLYFDQQRENALASILPFVASHVELASGRRILEIGCGAGGVLKAFVERGAQVTGVDLHEPSIEYAVRRFGAEAAGADWRFEMRDIYDVDAAGLDGPFDLIVMKDTIEHIHDQRRLLARLHEFLAPGGAVFFAFPPWQMPFGGHQQICEHRVLMRLPYRYRYGLEPREQFGRLAGVPVLRDFLTTSAYYLLVRG